jgi:hypothetical protein
MNYNGNPQMHEAKISTHVASPAALKNTTHPENATCFRTVRASGCVPQIC